MFRGFKVISLRWLPLMSQFVTTSIELEGKPMTDGFPHVFYFVFNHKPVLDGKDNAQMIET